MENEEKQDIKNNEEYGYDCTKIGFTKLDVQIWKQGSGDELKKWLGVGMYKTKFIFNNGSVTSYNNLKECEELDKALKEKLTEKLFNKMCEKYFELIEESKSAKTKEDIYKIMVKCWPMWIIFDILDNYPYFGTDYMLRRTMKIRTQYQDFYYILSKKLKNHSQNI
ncbi:MAG: hypothetical protein WC812_01255 [Candidatus Pacearchaeota archaeon]|jgi:hypothetical protein